jgi:glycine/D-amino acid oxidase-like deaminating enzyme
LIENQHEGQIDTGKMMKHLLQLANSLGVVLYTSCPIEKISEEERHQILSTPHGPFKCTSVLLANNAFINELLPEIDVVPGRGQVLITKPIKKLRIKGTFHYDKGYYYFRNIDDRILLGGGRNLAFKEEQTATFGTTLIIRKALEQLLQETILPDIPFEIETSWSGIMGFGKQIDPIVRQIKPGIFCAVRCNGMGIAMGSQTGQDAAELILNSL